MPNPIVQGVKQTTRDLAKQIAKSAAREPLEILKAARSQVTNLETRSKRNYPGQHQFQEQQPERKTPDEQKLKAQSQRLMQALEKEIEDIRNLEEQKKMQVVQQEQVQDQHEEQEKKQGFLGSIIAQGKKRRNMLGQKGKKGPSQPTGTTKAEVRKPPSG